MKLFGGLYYISILEHNQMYIALLLGRILKQHPIITPEGNSYGPTTSPIQYRLNIRYRLNIHLLHKYYHVNNKKDIIHSIPTIHKLI